MNMKVCFLKHLHTILPEKIQHVLVAVSGGVDSIVLLDLLQCSSLSLSVAHANFQLRLHESNADEEFVKNICKYQKIPFFSHRFDTKDYIQNHKCSIQMAARYLRYKWFLLLLKQLNLSHVALGHHFNDSLETFFINWMRGTGLKGLLGIPFYRNFIFRPLLPFTRSQIMQYAEIRRLTWREDTSNKNNKYLRNIIRNRIIPIFSEITPNLYKNFSTTLLNLNHEYSFARKHIEDILQKVTLKKQYAPFQWKIDISRLRTLYPLDAYLFKLFSPYGFNNIMDLRHLLYTQSGRQLFSKSHRIVNDRSCWWMVKQNHHIPHSYKIENTRTTIIHPISLSLSIKNTLDPTACIAIDCIKIIWPLQVRSWISGDYFYPLGMCHKKKLSKFFKDEKFSLLQKESTWVLVNGDKKIIWIIDYRLDDRFKITSDTKSILNIKRHL